MVEPGLFGGTVFLQGPFSASRHLLVEPPAEVRGSGVSLVLAFRGLDRLSPQFVYPVEVLVADEAVEDVRAVLDQG